MPVFNEEAALEAQRPPAAPLPGRRASVLLADRHRRQREHRCHARHRAGPRARAAGRRAAAHRSQGPRARAARGLVAQRREGPLLHGRRPVDGPARPAPARGAAAVGAQRPRHRHPPRALGAGRARPQARAHLARLQPPAAHRAARALLRRAVRLQGACTATAARRLLDDVRDDGWFFDTELLVLAQRRGLRIHEVPVDWVDDPDSRVDIVRTAIEDLRGVARLAAAGPVVRFMGVGVLSTIAYAVLYLAAARRARRRRRERRRAGHHRGGQHRRQPPPDLRRARARRARAPSRARGGRLRPHPGADEPRAREPAPASTPRRRAPSSWPCWSSRARRRRSRATSPCAPGSSPARGRRARRPRRRRAKTYGWWEHSRARWRSWRARRAAPAVASRSAWARRARRSTRPGAARAAGARRSTGPRRSRRPPSSSPPPVAPGSRSAVDHLVSDEVRALVARIEAEQGRLDVLVNDVWGARAPLRVGHAGVGARPRATGCGWCAWRSRPTSSPATTRCRC